MATIRYVDKSNGPYYTIQSAHDAAVDGDTVLIAEGNYTDGSDSRLIWTKRVHIKGDTENPDAVILGQTYDGPTAPALDFRIPQPIDGDLWVEGVRLQESTRSYGVVEIDSGDYFPSGWLRFNRCHFWARPAGAPKYAFRADFAANAGRVRVENCLFTLYLASVEPLRFGTGVAAGSQVEIHRAAVIPYPNEPYIGLQSADPLPGLSVDAAPSPTTGYGLSYGEWYAPQWLGQAYRIAGRETLEPGDALGQTQIALYRETAYQSGLLERTSWLQTSPDPITGEWSFEYLPTIHSTGDPQRYAVQINPPECYQAELLRWYTPEQAEG